jgi:outer membrane receptor protein involved in Fe transport
VQGSWGRYLQPQRVHELNALDGDVSFSPPEVADQVAMGIEGRVSGGFTWRVEGYSRRVASPSPEFLNLSREINPFLELQTDRVRIDPTRGRGSGIEILLTRNGSGPLSWSGSYVLAKAEEEVDGVWVPRTLDQRHTLNLHAAYRLGENWQVSAAYQHHTGWPVTEQSAEVQWIEGGASSPGFLLRRHFGPLNQVRLPAYRRLDFRVTWNVGMKDSHLEIFLDVFNVLNDRNLRAFQYDAEFRSPSSISTVRNAGDELLPILPTLGFRWVF